jgi:hypothetical protein
LHRCEHPPSALADAARCSRRFLVIKDHVSQGFWGDMSLAVLDELGNRRFGIPSPHHYQRRWSWLEVIGGEGFRLSRLIHPAPCHDGFLAATNRLQFVGLWVRSAGGSAQAPPVRSQVPECGERAR